MRSCGQQEAKPANRGNTNRLSQDGEVPVMRTIAVANQKGGCGKTTVCINLSASLAREGRRVLLVDLDPQGHCALGLAVPNDQIDLSILDCLRSVSADQPIELSQVTWQITPNLDLAPSCLDMARFEPECGTDPAAEHLLGQLLEQIAGRYDYIFVDCPPHLGLLMRNAVRAADEVIIPVDTGYFSLHGLTREMQTAEEIFVEAGRKVVIRVLANQYDVRTKLAREILAELRREFEGAIFSTIINFNTKLKEGASFGQPIVEFAPASMGARDFQKLAREMMAAEPVAATPTDEMLKHVEKMAAEADRLLATTATLVGQAPKPGHTGAETIPASHEQISAKIEAIYGARQTPEGVLFRSRLPEATQVQIAGDFNDWMPHTLPMTPDNGDGDFVARIKLPSGRYRYRLVIDGRWSHDPANPQVETNEYGELNSIVDVS